MNANDSTALAPTAGQATGASSQVRNETNHRNVTAVLPGDGTLRIPKLASSPGPETMYRLCGAQARTRARRPQLPASVRIEALESHVAGLEARILLLEAELRNRRSF